MLLPDIFERHRFFPKGVIHIGAHLCEEHDTYQRVGVGDECILWIEANPDLVLKARGMYPAAKIVQAVISDREEVVTFRVTNNGESSSFLPLKLHAVFHPEISEVSQIQLTTTTLPALMRELREDPTQYDLLNMDIQGAELHALKGMEDLLCHFRGIYLEVNEQELYAGCGLYPEVSAFLLHHGFSLVERYITNSSWGDAFFVRPAVSE